MAPPPPIALADLATGGLVAPAGHEAACTALAEALLASGHAVINLHKRPTELEAAARALAEFWQRDGEQKAALRPPQLRDGVGYRALTDERELLEHRVGPWLRDDAPLPALAAASSALDPIARCLLAALCRSAFVRLPGSALTPALDDLPLPPRAWASSSLQCFRYRAGSGGCEGHEDRPLLVLIYAPGQPGLQVQDAGGQWHPVDLGPKQLLLLAGHALEHATCGLIRSGRHRIVLNGAERRSLAYKLAAQPGATINLVPALQAAGHDLGSAVDRYPQPITYQQLMARFEATHRTANPTAPATGAAAAAGGGAAARDAAGGAAPGGRAAGGAAGGGRAASAAAGRRAAPGAAAAAAAAESAAGAAERQPKRARGQSPPVLVDDEPGREQGLTIRVRGPDGADTVFRVRRSTLWNLVAHAWCARAAVDPEIARFVFDDMRCNPNATIEDHGMEDGDVVDAFFQELGD